MESTYVPVPLYNTFPEEIAEVTQKMLAEGDFVTNRDDIKTDKEAKRTAKR